MKSKCLSVKTLAIPFNSALRAEFVDVQTNQISASKKDFLLLMFKDKILYAVSVNYNLFVDCYTMNVFSINTP